MKISFVKMQAQGNDFIIVDSGKINLGEEEFSQLAKSVCNRHFGIGADGLVLLDKAKPQMKIYNADGSIAEMCGSALRCCGALLTAETGKRELAIWTDSGLKAVFRDETDPEYITAEIGTLVLQKENVTIEGFTGTYVNAGNPHFVIICEDLSDNPHLQAGKLISENAFFPEGVNVEFMRVISHAEAEIKVWERGAGATLACGTGAAASVFTGQKKGLLQDEVKVFVPGGDVLISNKNDKFYVGGKTSLIASGEYLWKV
ncbi:MAG TPA: diaminopimelate epimerase [Candidatus Cloacimonadota bacterium]|nr:diaminopimelate epimerase [Candidatus Cloacimonadota bacterium]